MALFESYERRIKQITKFLNANGISSIEEAEKITKANTWLLEVAENTGARYLNTISVLMGDDGYLIDAYQNGDGLHLNEDGFRLVLDYQRTHGWN